MSGVINTIGRLVGADDISFGQNSYVYVDVNGVARRVNQVNAGSVPFQGYAQASVQDLVNGSKNLPLGGSSLGVVNTTVLSGPVYGSGATSGYVKNYASGLLQFGQGIATADIPSGIPASSIGSGTVNNSEFGYLDGVTSNIQSQINAMNSSVLILDALKYFEPPSAPKLNYIGSGTAEVWANPLAPALVKMNGFPDVVNPGQYIHSATASISDSKYRMNVATVVFNMSSNVWGKEHDNQWYAVFAEDAASAELGTFVMKAMPYLRQRHQAGQAITPGTNPDNTVATDYSFAANELVGGYIYVLSGADRGALRKITVNGTSTVSYEGGAVLATGDWFIVLPPSLNFRRIADVYNEGANFYRIGDIVHGFPYEVLTAITTWYVCPFTTNRANVGVGAGGAGGETAASGNFGNAFLLRNVVLTAGVRYEVLVGAGGAAGTTGGLSYFTNFVATAGQTSLVPGPSGTINPVARALMGDNYCDGGATGAAGNSGFFFVYYDR